MSADSMVTHHGGFHLIMTGVLGAGLAWRASAWTVEASRD